MTTVAPAAVADPLADGGHVCLVIDDDQAYQDLAADFLLAGSAAAEKTVVFGPADSAPQERLAPFADIVADPHVDFLGGGRLDPAVMFAMFREQAGLAREEGYTRLRVAADMDWLLPAAPTSDEALAFEVLLDRVVGELGATVLCAYRPTSFVAETVLGMTCTHPIVVGGDADPPFRLVADRAGGWVLAGELDFACASILAAALRATAANPWFLDVEALEFTDMAGMRTIAAAAADSGTTLELRGASPRLRRLWRVVGLDERAPAVRFADPRGAARTS